MNVANIKSAPEGLTVLRDGNEILLREGEALRWGDELVNNGQSQIVVSIPAQNENQTATELTMEPGSRSQLVEKDTPYNDGSSRTEVLALTDGVELYDVDQEVTTTYGLVGAGLLAAGSGLGAGAVAAGAGAGALGAALLLDDDEDTDGGTNPGPNPPPPPPGTGDPSGVAGGAESLSNSLEQTPLAPVAAVTDGVSGGAEEVGNQIQDGGASDPSGTAGLLADVVGTTQDGYENNTDGLVGVVSNVSDGIDSGAEGTALDPLLDPVAQTTGEVADGLADVGNTLQNDGSQLSPVTSDLLSPIVGTDDQAGSTGIEGTLSQVGDGLTDLTNPDSPLAPLEPVTTAVDEQLLGGVEGGVSTVGDAIVDGSSQAGEGAALVETVGTLLGGDSTATTADGGASPLDPLLSADPTSSITSIANGEDPTSGITGGLG